MSVDVASVLSSSAARARSRGHAWTVAAGASLALALAVRLVLVWSRVTPEYFPDEYLYTALGRSLSQLHGPTIRGGAAHFPALLQPLVTAPAWRVGNVDTGYRLVQTIESVFFTLAAVPVYLLARRLALPRWVAACTAGIALLVPDGVYAGFVLADPIAYPIVMAAVLAAVFAIARPRPRTQGAFLLLAVLATAARIQFVVLPVCYLVAAALVGLRERDLRRTLREQRAVLFLLAIVVVGLAASAPTRLLGYYRSDLHLHLHLVATAASLGRNALVLAYAGGWILVPGAVLGAALALARPRTRVELAFGAVVTTLGAALLLETSFIGTIAHERYVFYLIPLAAISFALYASRGWPLRRLHLGLVAGMFLLSTQPLLAGYAQAGNDDHSPFLYAVMWLELRIGNGATALVIAAVAAVLAAVATATSFRPRQGTAVVLAATLVLCGASYAGAVAFDTANSHNVRAHFLPGDRSWVDDAHVGPVTLVAGFHGKAAAAEGQLFWNRSIDRVAVLPGGKPPDGMAASLINVTPDGTLEVHGQPLRTALLLDEYGGTLVPQGGTILGTSPAYTLWRPAGAARLALYMLGRYRDGRIAPQGAILVWPPRAGHGIKGWLELELGGPDRPGALKLTVKHGTQRWFFRAASGHTVRARIPICSKGPWSADLSAPPEEHVGFRAISGRTSVPTLVPDRAACSQGSSSSTASRGSA